MKTCPKCNIPIGDHPANVCLDVLFATKVMGWKAKAYYTTFDEERIKEFWWHKGKQPIHIVRLWFPSTNISHAMEGVEKFANDEHVFELMWIPRSLAEQEPFWSAMIRENLIPKDVWDETPAKQTNAFAKTVPLAITRALILWAMEKE